MNDIRATLLEYIEKEIFPKYERNDYGHGIKHIDYVINRSLNFAKKIENINYEMVYVIAAYHDIGHWIDPKNHEKISSEILLNDDKLKEFFTEEEIKIMSEAVYDHRASLGGEPRSIYGKIVASADKNTLLEQPLLRTYTYRIVHYPEATLKEVVEDSRQHLIEKFGKKGYASDKMYFEDLDYNKFLQDIDEITSDVDKFREKYFQVNGINDVEKNMLFIFDEIKKSNTNLSLDKLLYCVYIKLNTDKPFYEIKNRILELKGINEYEYYVKNVDKDLIKYVENNIFPKYKLNDKAHGIVHIMEVIRRCFALNSTYGLNLDDNMLYAMAACHDINKYVDSDIHEKLAAKAFREDTGMKKFFNDESIEIISEAIEDHRSSKEDEPRSIYGKLISSADRNTTVEMVFIRSFFVALGNGKNSNRDTVVEDYLEYTWKRLSKRYSEKSPENMFFEDDIYRLFLQDMRNLLHQPEMFKNYYCEVNNINDRTKLVKEYDNEEKGVTYKYIKNYN